MNWFTSQTPPADGRLYLRLIWDDGGQWRADVVRARGAVCEERPWTRRLSFLGPLPEPVRPDA